MNRSKSILLVNLAGFYEGILNNENNKIGYSMGMNTLPIAELRKLLSAVSEHGQQHLIEVEDDLQQTTFLLSEAINKLGDSFMAIHEAITNQQAVIEGLLDKRDIDHADHDLLETYKNKISQDVDAAVTSLQFQDLTSQLIARTVNRVNGLKTLLEALATHGNGANQDQAQEQQDITQYLESLNNSFHAGSHALTGGLSRRSVGQQDMRSGDIDLF